jgi:hypothetical protein
VAASKLFFSMTPLPPWSKKPLADFEETAHA